MLLLVIASVILPSVLGNCCFPLRFSGKLYQPSSKQASTFSIDFKLEKFITRPLFNNTNIRYVLNDFASGDTFIRQTDGTCLKTKYPGSSAIKHCVPASAQKIGDGYFGPENGGLAIQNYRYKDADNQVNAAVSKEGCIPVLTVVSVGNLVRTSIYDDIKVDASQRSDILQDTSDCIDSDIIG